MEPMGLGEAEEKIDGSVILRPGPKETLAHVAREPRDRMVGCDEPDGDAAPPEAAGKREAPMRAAHDQRAGVLFRRGCAVGWLLRWHANPQGSRLAALQQRVLSGTRLEPHPSGDRALSARAVYADGAREALRGIARAGAKPLQRA